ncbi:hypothetical protein BGZ94_002178, partial [Podila epigama]
MVIFGGVTNSSVNPYGTNVPGSNDLWVWSTTQRTWSQPLTQFPNAANNAPAPQKFFSSIALQSQGKMLSLVSNNTPNVPTGNLLMLDTNFWANAAVAPSPRMGAAVGTSASTIFVHGGASVGTSGQPSTSALDDLVKL